MASMIKLVRKYDTKVVALAGHGALRYRRSRTVSVFAIA
ncbi:hypothetical protein AWB69_01021 [Caballeronia udeis]|uniref:Uncharacterized protein n=1 Tax=Caballeronia udeis TaxID=1232866 RepID=A0A158FE38_9BURK|nr:hypothetical protein AWB69_01021 [Caballeronia udeis]